MKHNLVIKPRPSDFILGSTSPIQFKAVSNGTWKVWFDEDQRNPNFETDGCSCYSGNKSVDSQMDFLISIGKIDINMVALFTSMGYMDTNSIDGKAHFHSSPRFTEIMTGNGVLGNSMPEVFDAIRANGIVPWTALPFTQTMTQQEYFNPTNLARMKVMGQKFLALVGGKQFLQYHWIWNDSIKNMSLMQSASLQAPCGLGIAVNDGWNQTTPTDPPVSQAVQHAVMETEVFAPSCDISDNYIPRSKVLDAGYPIPFCIQAIVAPISAPPPSPVPTQQHQVFAPTIAPTQQNVNILTQIVNLYIQILNLLSPKGRQNLGSTQMNYSIFKSRTFYTLLVTFLYNVYAAFSGQIPPAYSGVIDALMTMLATYFHVAGVQNAAVSSATLGRASSGQ